MLAKKIISLLIVLSCLLSSVFQSVGFAEETTAMTAILSELSTSKVGDKVSIADDDYIGIPVELTTFYSGTSVTDGMNGTPIILYVINTNTERIGTETDVNIIRSMLDRGYVVSVLDYLNSPLAVSPDLEWSVHKVMSKLANGDYFTASAFPASGTYYETFVVPAGYDVSLNHVYWTFDQHGADGILEKIVETWNNDFRAVKGSYLVKWVDENGNRKKTQNGFDGTEPTWLNAFGAADSNGQYIRVKHTLAETIEDCAKPDGTMVDLNLYMHVIYPTNPTNEVPVMALSSSSEHLAWGAVKEARPQLAGFTFNGYAGVMYDYGYVPMARKDHYDYFDGGTNGAVSGDHMIYSLQQYDTAKSNTAAMRLIRYLSMSDSKFKFDVDKVGVFGNSKGGCMTFLGEEHPENVYSGRYTEGHHGESRYDNGKTETVGKVRGGEVQPWLSYDGTEIDSGADFVYASCGDNGYDITKNHAPTFVANNVPEEGSFVNANPIVNACRIYDVPSLYVEDGQGHTFTYGEDLRYNFDTYEALFDFAAYWLKDEPVSVVYSDPSNGKSGIGAVSPVTIHFTGSVAKSEIEKIQIKDSANNSVSVKWQSMYGDTEWSFVPSEPYQCNTKYTVTIPSNLKGSNGKEMGAAYVFSYTSDHETTLSSETIADGNDVFASFDASSLGANADQYVLRFYVDNDAANVADVYALYGFNSTDKTYTSQALVKRVNLRGSGYYEVDVASCLASVTNGQSIGFKISPMKTAGVSDVYTMDSNLTGITIGSGVANHEYTTAPDNSPALKVWNFPLTTNYYNDNFYWGSKDIFTHSSLISPVSAADYGRRYTISVDVYDTVSRRVQMYLNTKMGYYSNRVQDMHRNICNDFTEANSWKTFEFVYDVYDSIYGADNFTKTLTFNLATTGNIDIPAYFKNLKVTETVTDVNVTSVTLSSFEDDVVPNKEAESTHPFKVEKNGVGTEYDSWGAALATYTKGDVLKLQSNYTYTDTDAYKLGGFESLDIDLNGYKIYVNSQTKSLLIGNASLGSSGVMNATGAVTMKNGYIYLKNTPLISYEGSTEADKTFDFQFDDVEFRLSGNANLKYFATAVNTPNDLALESNVAFNDCCFDVNENKLTSSSLVLYPSGVGNLSVNYEVNGGQILLEDYKKVSISDSFPVLKFGKNAENTYTALVMPEGVTPMEGIFRLDDGAGSFTTSKTENELTEYALVAKANSTTYGIIPTNYSSADAYPFVVFAANGDFKGAASVWGNSGSGAMTVLMNAGAGATVLLRKDYTFTSSDIYPNLAFNSGWRTLDLGGHTLTNTRTRAIFEACVKRSYMCYMNVMNGTIVTGNAPVVSYSHYSNSNYNESTLGGFDFRFKNITFRLCENSQASEMFASYATNGKVKAYTTLEDCTIDMMTHSPAKDITLFNVGDSSGTVPSVMTVKGGQLKAASFDKITLSKITGEGNSLDIQKDKQGYYMSVLMPNGATVTEEKLSVKEGEGVYVASEEGTENTLYVLDVVETTKYGVIPSAYASSNDYPFAVFQSDTTFCGAFGNSCDALSAMESAGEGAVLLLRRNYTMTTADNAVAFGSKLASFTFDLGGNALTSSSNSAVLQATTSDDVKTKCNVINGSIVLTGDKPCLTFADGGKSKEYEIAFQDISFKTSASFAAGDLIVGCETDKATVSITLTGCTYDLTTNAPTSAVNIFTAGRASGTAAVTVTVVGGEMQVSDFAKVTISNVKNQNSSVKLVKDAEGYYPILTVPASVSAPTEQIMTDTGCAGYIEMKNDGSSVLYTVGLDEETEYGTIPAAYAYAKLYPFAVFKEDKTFVGAFSFWGSNTGGGALGSLYNNDNGVLLLRADYAMNNSNSQNGYPNLGHHNVTGIVDLGGHVFDTSAATGQTMFSYGAKSATGTFGMNVKNGTIVVGKNPVAKFYYIAGGNQTDVLQYDFNNVTFKLGSGAEDGSVLFDYGTMPQTERINLSLKLTDCVYDLESNPDGKALTLFSAGDADGYIPTSISVYGGEVKATSLEKITLMASNNASSGVSMDANSEGALLRLLLKKGAAAPEDSITVGDTKYHFVLKTEGETYDTYEPEAVVTTKYGDIPAAYADANTYPFAAFKDGKFVGAYRYWGDHHAQSDSALIACPTGGTILLRQSQGTWGDDRRDYANLGWNTKDITLDLNGLTYDAATHDTWMFNYLARKGDHALNVTVKNGTILFGRSGVINFSDSFDGSDNVSFMFENVKFQYSNTQLGSTPLHKIIKYGSYTESTTQTINTSVNYKNCTFDLATAPLSANVALFEAGESGDVVKTTMRVIGGKIIAPQTITNSWTEVNGASSSITFEADTDGAYTSLIVPNGTSLPDADVISGKNLLRWKQSAVGDTQTTYTLAEKSDDIAASVTAEGLKVENIKEAVTVIVGVYAGNTLVTTKLLPVSSDLIKTFAELDITATGGKTIKVFVWDMDTLQPLAPSAEKCFE